MKVYDCFPFFNELDVLEIRLKELWDVVDVFVLAESNLSHSGKPKEYIFENNKQRCSHVDPEQPICIALLQVVFYD